MTKRLPMAALLLTVLAAADARAQVSDANKGSARELALEGLKALEAKDFPRAADLFERAEALFHAPTILIGLARARAALGKLVAAREAYNRVVNETVPPSASPPFLKAIEDAKHEILELGPRVPSVFIAVEGAGSARVSATIDGELVPSVALGAKRPVDPGKHVVRVGAAGFETSEAEFSVAEGQTETVHITLKPGNGIPPGTEAAGPGAAAPPRHGSAWPIGDRVPVGRSQRKTYGYATAGVGAAGLLMGGITGAMAAAKRGTIVGHCTDGICPPAYGSDIEAFHTYGTLSTAGFIAGGVLTATGIVLVVTTPSDKTTAEVTPVFGPGFVGVRGSF